MADSLLTAPEARRLGTTLGDLQNRLRRIEEGQRATQLDYSSLLYPLVIRDPTTGDVVGSIGQQPDGGVAVIPVGGPPPPQPSDPIVTPIMAGLNAEWDGRFAADAPRPSNFGYIGVHVGGAASFITDPSNMVGVLSEPGVLPIAPLTGPTFVRFVPYNNSTPPVSGPASATVSGTPAQVVAQAVLDGIVTETALAAQAVSTAKMKLAAVTPDILAAKAVTVPAIGDAAVTAPALNASSVTANAVSANAVYAGAIQALAVTAGKVAADSIGANELAANAVNADHVAAGAISAGKLAADSVTANAVAAGAIQAGSLAANSVTAGALAAGSVTAAKLEAVLAIASRFIAGSATGTRAEMNANGFEAWAGTLQTFRVNAANGEVMMLGLYKTANAGMRIELGGSNGADEVRFYQTQTTYGRINAEPGPGSSAAVAMRAQILSVSGGPDLETGVFAYNAETALELRTPSYESQYNTNAQTGFQRSAVSAVSDAVNIWGGSTRLQGRARWGAGQVVFTYRNSSDSIVNNAELQYRAYGGNSPMLYSPAGDMGFVWQTNGEMWLGRPSGTVTGAYGAYWNTPSGRTSKKNERPLRLRAGQARDGLRQVPAKMWNYTEEAVPDEHPPAVITRKARNPRFDPATGRAVVDQSTGNPVYDEDEYEVPTLTHKPHIFPIAEDLAAVLPELVLDRPGIPGGYGVDLRDVVGFLWRVCQELDADVTATQRSAGRVPVSGVEPVPVTGTGFYEENGTLYYRNSTGQTRRVT